MLLLLLITLNISGPKSSDHDLTLLLCIMLCLLPLDRQGWAIPNRLWNLWRSRRCSNGTNSNGTNTNGISGSSVVPIAMVPITIASVIAVVAAASTIDPAAYEHSF